MTATTLGALVYLFYTKYLPGENLVLMITDVLLIVLALAMLVLAGVTFVRRRGSNVEPTSG